MHDGGAKRRLSGGCRQSFRWHTIRPISCCKERPFPYCLRSLGGDPKQALRSHGVHTAIGRFPEFFSARAIFFLEAVAKDFEKPRRYVLQPQDGVSV